MLIFNYFDWRDFFSINAVFWSLAIEAQFYVVLPLAVGMASNACGRRGWLSVVSVIAGFYLVGTLARGLEYSQAVAESGPRRDTYFMTIFAYLDLFAAGMMVAVADRLASDRLRRSVTLRWILVTLGAALFLGANLWSWMAAPHGWQGGHGLGYTVGFPVVLCAGVALLLTAVVAWPDGGPAFLHARPLVAIGLISYSLYLYHVGVQIVLRKVWPPGSLPGGQFEPLVFGLLALPATLVLSALLFALVERPAMRWGARYSRLHTPPPISF